MPELLVEHHRNEADEKAIIVLILLEGEDEIGGREFSPFAKIGSDLRKWERIYRERRVSKGRSFGCSWLDDFADQSVVGIAEDTKKWMVVLFGLEPGLKSSKIAHRPEGGGTIDITDLDVRSDQEDPALRVPVISPTSDIDIRINNPHNLCGCLFEVATIRNRELNRAPNICLLEASLVSRKLLLIHRSIPLILEHRVLGVHTPSIRDGIDSQSQYCPE